MFRNIVVGISGGVDSAVAAFLLKERGYNVLGVFMKNWDEYDELGHCSGEHDLLDAKFACQKIGIELREVNYVKDYWNSVFINFLEDYQNGLTPNPDILCNKYIKFSLFYKYALEQLGYDAIATGHYASTSFGPFLEQFQEDGDVRLLMPKDTFKDQTFFLSGVPRSSFCRTMFPLSNYWKSEVKLLARQCGLSQLANKKESTGICFVGRRNFKDFIKKYIPCKLGNFVDVDTGKIVGQHNGVHQWTIGQRCQLHSCLQPYFVSQKDIHSNTLFVAAGHNHEKLFADEMITTTANWLCASQPILLQENHELRCRFRFQHTKPLVDCTIRNISTMPGSGMIVNLDKPLRALTPGQYAVFYNDTDCLGSARILSATMRSTKAMDDVIGSQKCDYVAVKPPKKYKIPSTS